MNVRHALLTVFAAALLVGLAGCDVLDVEPEDTVQTEDAFRTLTDVEAVLNATYSGLQGGGVYGGFPVMAADFSAGNSVFGGSFTSWNNAQNFNIISTHGPSEQVWDDHYDVILNANTILERIDEAEDLTDDDRARITGQVQFIRGLMYFNLVRWFAQPYEPGGTNGQPGVVLVTDAIQNFGDATDNELTDQPRATVQATYDLILNDLNDAISKLGPIGDRNRASATAAQALRAKVYLYQGRYADAAADAEAVLGTGEVEIIERPSALYSSASETNNEIIFGVANNETDNTGVNAFPTSFYLPGDLGGRGDITVSNGLLGAYESGDLRGFGGEGQPDGDFLIYAFDDGGGAQGWTNKWTDPNLGDDAIVLRGAEMALIAAEGIARSDYANRADDAEAYLDLVRARSNASNIDPASQQELIFAIITERRLELAFEGDYRHDLVRLRLPMGPTVPGDPQRILPIPQIEIDINSALTEDDQNPGY